MTQHLSIVEYLQAIEFAVAWTNQAFKKSGVKVRFKLVKTMLARGYNENSTTYEGNLDDLRTGTGLQKVRNKRNRKNADLVALIREGGLYCGIGYYVVVPTQLTEHLGFQVTSRDCMPSTFAHEAGHNMGLNHDRFIEPPASNSVYNFGYVNLPARIRTIMAYDNECRANGFSCTEIQYLSTPKKKFQGNKIGVKKGKPGAADAARKLNENRKGIAAYR